jgi:large subunit ribosomal protein L24
MMKLRKDDKVKIISGKDRGQEGVVERVLAGDSRVLVKDLNQYTRHLKKSAKVPEGGRIKMSRPIAVANAMLICTKCNKPTRVGIKTIDGKKARACKKCGEIV